MKISKTMTNAELDAELAEMEKRASALLYSKIRAWERIREKIIEEINHKLNKTENRISRNIDLLKEEANDLEKSLKKQNIDVEYVATTYNVNLTRSLRLFGCLIYESRKIHGGYEYNVKDCETLKTLCTLETIDEAIEEVLTKTKSSYTVDEIKKKYWDYETE
ncbi:hypothetical protein C6Y02_16880 [Bacillus sp. NMCC4]|uniref:hypothetical protein n=1 Tax=Bacillus sp. NMCC4 TaxID=2108539 RepID=UPI000D046EE8|nr:hypothetical protein [Bacillus sp. NMCC4]PRS35688.1 hypothetical protein C6Y02_16880 [Bacillus sp. NMCC4]